MIKKTLSLFAFLAVSAFATSSLMADCGGCAEKADCDKSAAECATEKKDCAEKCDKEKAECDKSAKDCEKKKSECSDKKADADTH